MGLQLFGLETLDALDFGKVNAAFKKELDRCVKDCQDRPGDETTRSVVMTFAMKPAAAEGGECDAVYGEFEIKSKVPVRRSRTYHFGVKKTGTLVFSDECADNVDQTSLFEADEEGKAHRPMPKDPDDDDCDGKSRGSGK